MKKAELTFVERVTKRMNITPDQKVQNFFDKNKKFHEKQIAIRKEELIDLREKLAETEEELEAVVETIDMDRIKTGDAQKSYIGDYNSAVSAAMNAVERIEAQIKAKEEEIVAFEKRWKTISE